MGNSDERRTGGQTLRLIHVATVPESLWFFFGGQIRYMKSRGMDVRAISSAGRLLDAFARRERISVMPVNMRRKISPVADLVALGQLARQLRRWPCSIVHAHTPKAGLLGMLAAWVTNVPVRLYHLHGLPLETATGWKRSLLWTTEWLACRLAHRVLCVSESLRREALRWELCPADKIKVLRGGSCNGVDALQHFNPDRCNGGGIRERLGIPPTARVLGFVGRMARDKGIRELVESWNMLSDARPDLHWIVVGDLDTRDALPCAMLARLQQNPRVHLVGFVPDAVEWYAAMDVCVLPTYREGLPGVLIEAAAMGIPVVATRVTGCVDAVVDGETGTLVSPRDPVELSTAIARYLDNPALCQGHGQAARRRVLRDFRPESIWESLYHEYEALLREKGLEVSHAVDAGGTRNAA